MEIDNRAGSARRLRGSTCAPRTDREVAEGARLLRWWIQEAPQPQFEILLQGISGEMQQALGRCGRIRGFICDEKRQLRLCNNDNGGEKSKLVYTGRLMPFDASSHLKPLFQAGVLGSLRCPTILSQRGLAWPLLEFVLVNDAKHFPSCKVHITQQILDPNRK